MKAGVFDEDDDEANAIADTDNKMDTREYGSDAVDFVNEVQNKLEKNIE